MPIMQKKLVFFKKKPMEIAALLIPMYTLAIGLRWPQIGQIFLLYRYVSITICLLLSLQVIKHHNILQTKVFVCIVLLQVILIATTLINNPANIIYSIQLAIYAIIPFFILSFFSIKINLNTICEGILLSLEILVVTNFIIMMIFPRGFYSTESSNTITAYYLFGSKNQMVAPVMTCIFFEFENMRLKNRFIFSKILICLMCIFELIIGGSGTGITLLITFFCTCFFTNARNNGLAQQIDFCNYFLISWICNPTNSKHILFLHSEYFAQISYFIRSNNYMGFRSRKIFIALVNWHRRRIAVNC